MDFSRIEFDLPKEMIPYLTSDDKDMQLLQKALVLYPYIKNDTISHGRAAEILGIYKMDLIVMYGNLGLPYIDMSADEFEAELDSLRKFTGN